MKISATINYTEFDFDFQVPNNDLKLWEGYKMVTIGPGELQPYITFNEEEGVVTNLYVHKDIDTPKEIVLERLLEMLKEYNDARQMGFEVESDIDDELNSRKHYDPKLIRVRPLVLSAFQVNRDIDKGKIDLNPEFQRNFVWDDIRKSRLIESMLLRIPLPAFYFAEDNRGNFQVVDGLQRLTVINHYLNNKFKLKYLEYLWDCEGKYYSADPDNGIDGPQALSEEYVSRIETTQLNINVIEASSPLRVKYDIFFRINTGGRPLNNQEIRNCFAFQPIRVLLRRMASSPIFKEATGYSISDTRMDAQELALRFLGFHFFRDLYNGNMNAFLDIVSDKLNDYEESKLNEAENLYYKSLQLAFHLFDKYSFRKCLSYHLQPGKRRQFINKSMFVVLTSLLSKVDSNLVFEKPEMEFVFQLANELEENDKLFDALTTGTSSKSNIEYVFNVFENLLHDYLFKV